MILSQKCERKKIGKFVDNEFGGNTTYCVKLKNETESSTFYESAMRQHFLVGKSSFAGILSAFVQHYGDYPCNLIYFVLTPQNHGNEDSICDKRYVAKLEEDSIFNIL